MEKMVFLVLFLLLLINPAYSLEIDSEVEKQLNDNPEVSVIIKLKDQSNDAVETAMKQETISSLDNEFEKKNEYSIINAMSGEITRDGLETLKQDSNVERIEYNYPVKSFLQDTINLINVSLVHELLFNNVNITGSEQTICIIDTGINYTHPAFDNRVLDGHCYSDSGACSGSTSLAGLDASIDNNGHGTHVAGIAAGNNTIIGVAPESNLISIKALDENGSGSISDAINGIDWCVSNSTIYNITVISMSLGTDALFSSSCDSNFISLSTSINNAIANNISVVVASGNAGNTTSISSPACITNSTSVGASTKTDTVASFSNRNFITDLFAPGQNVNSSVPGDGCLNCDSSLYKVLSGTSMAAPHVAGAFAILRQLNSTIYPFEIEELLNRTGRKLDDTSGSGLFFSIVDLFNASMTLNDLINPIITLDIANDSFVNDTMFNFTIEDHTLVNCSLYTNSTGIFELNNTIDLTNDGSYNITVENYDDGLYDWNVECFDSRNNNAFSSNNFTIRIDKTIPTINYIINSTVEFNLENLTINWTSNDNNLNDSFVNLSYSNGTSIGIYTNEATLSNESLTEIGNYTLIFYANDSANNINITQANIEVVETFPNLILDEPRNITYNINESIDLNFTITNNFTNIYYNLDDNDNTTITENSTFNATEGQHILYLFVNNSFDRESSARQSFIVDITNPIVSLISPSNSTVSTDDDVTFSYNVTDFGISNCSLYIDNSLDQSTSSVTTETTLSFDKNGMSNGDYVWYVSCTDYGNLNSNSISYNLKINVTSTSSPSGGSGGGGGGGGGGAGDSTIDTGTTIEEAAPTPVDISNIAEQQTQETQTGEKKEEASGITGAAVKEGEGKLTKTSIAIITTTALAALGLLGYFGRGFISRKITDIIYKIRYR
ncbi:S8 family serine peptidase [Candidatus Woesearchaeota archaeon]|nr:S8 family serine peptidase [Candidatus Woesearchaeota archaeon]